MNGKFEDKLTQLAFGEISAEEAARLEAQAKSDPVAARRLAQYRHMRAELSTLKDVPADQMSKERLRDAILGQGLKPAPAVRQGFSWLWMPAMACAIAFTAMTFNRPGTGAGQPVVVAQNTEATASKPVGLTQPRGVDTVVVNDREAPVIASSVDEVEDELQWEVVRMEDIEAPRPRATTRRSSAARPRTTVRRSEPREADFSAEALVQGDVPPARKGSGRAPSREQDTPVARETSFDDTAPIVLIEPTEDLPGATQRATEVGSASNVLVGG